MEKLQVTYEFFGSTSQEDYKVIDARCYINGKHTFDYWLMLNEPDTIWSYVRVRSNKDSRKQIASFNIKKWK